MWAGEAEDEAEEGGAVCSVLLGNWGGGGGGFFNSVDSKVFIEQ